jgi:AraC-like DNA-binding protein
MQSREQLQDGALAVGFNMLKELVNIRPSEVHIARRAPQNVVPYEQFFGVRPRFDAEQYALVFPSEILQLPVIGADKELRAVLELSVERYRLIQEPNVSDRVLRLLRAEILFDTCTLEVAAEALRIHPRTLKRRLHSEGTSWRILHNRVRFEVACELIGGTNLTITEVALALNYADASAFAHAFNRSAGVAPSEWRNSIADSFIATE